MINAVRKSYGVDYYLKGGKWIGTIGNGGRYFILVLGSVEIVWYAIWARERFN